MVQRRGIAMYGFATNKTIRRIDITAAKNSFDARFDDLNLEEEKQEQFLEDVEQTKKMERKRKLKSKHDTQEERVEYEQSDRKLTKLEKEFNREFVQGVAINEDGKKKIIFKYKFKGDN